MASFLYDLVKPLVEKLINEAIAEAHHVFCFTCIVKQFEEERASLEPQRITIEQRVKDARERDRDILANVGSWEEEIDKLNQVDTKTKQTCFFGFCPNCIWRYKKGKELANNLEKIKELKREKFENIELPRPVPGVDRYSSKDYISFESRKSKYKELLDALKDDNNYITGLQGMGGTGKTTLAKEVGKELKESGQFAYVVDTTVSSTPDIKKIQDDIAGSLRLEWGVCNESDRPKKLWSRLTNGDKILVILDDVWDRGPPLDFDAIGIPKQDTHKGCRVLVTSRNKQTFNNMDCDKIIELGLLSEEEAWIMFKKYAKLSDNTSQKLINKGRKIAKECKQLPVAISVIAGSLKGQQNREHEWDVTLKSLKKPVSMHGVDDDMVGIYNCLKISYDNLKDEKAKGLFLLCSVFREDEEISIEVLTRLCIGVGLLGEDYGSYDDARNKVVVAKNKLVDSCLLLEDEKRIYSTWSLVAEKSLKMHDLVREAAQWIANKEIQCVKLFDKNEKSSVEKQTNIKYLLCEGKAMDIFNLKFVGSKLEALIFKADKDDGCIEVPKSFFENVIKLRVLYFSGKDQQPLSLPSYFFFGYISLPPSIQLLKNIRSMLVDDVDLGDISILGNLQSLETLDLVECKIKELPDQITKLRKFKLLKLEFCEIRMNNPFEVIERCLSLEELYFKDSFNNFCQEITLPELKRYHIDNAISSFYLNRTSRFPKYVVFCGDEECQFSEETLKYCMQTAEALYLEGIKGEWRNLMPEIVPLEHGMNDLVELHLGGISQLRRLIDTISSRVPNVLSNLVVLELKNMENLEELFNGKINLCNLKSITLENCHMLVSILPFHSAQDLPVLEAIRIRKCNRLQYVFGQSQQVELVSLTELELSELPKFIGVTMSSCVKAQIQLDPHDCSVASESNSYGLNIWERLRISSKILCNIKEIVLTHFPKMKSVFILSIDLIMQLETLKIMNCDELKHVIIDTGDHNTGGNNWVNVFPKLKELHVEDCAQLEYIIFGPDTNDHQNHMEVQLHFPELTDLNLAGLPSLVAMCPKQYRITFPSFQFLKLVNCSQLDDSIIKELSGKVDGFLTLESLWVENILSLNEIIDGQQLDLSLTFIVLTDLPMMTCLFVGPKYSFALKNLTHITIRQCDKLKSVFSISILRFLPQLGYLTIEECKELEYIIEDDLENKNNSNSLSSITYFPKLAGLSVRKCNKLKFVISTSILRFLPQLWSLKIEDCEELEHIIEDDDDHLSSTTCFPKLVGLGVIKCNKLKYVLPFSVCKELPELNVLVIKEANELEEIFKTEDDHKVDIPNLNILALDMLPSLCCAQGNQFQAVKNRFVRNCQELSTLNSASTTNIIEEIKDLCSKIDTELYRIVRRLFKQLPSSETTEHFDAGIGAQATLEHKSDLAGVENDRIEQLQSAETTEDFELPSDENVTNLAILPTNSELEGSTSEEKTAVAIMSIDSGTKKESLMQVVASKQKGIEIEGTTKINNDQVSLNGDALMKVNSYVEEQSSKDDEIIVSKTKPSSPSITSLIASQFPSMPSKGDPFLVKRELEQLVSKNHLDYENLSLLTDFLVRNPSVYLMDTSLPNRYKGCAYNLLAELLKFLETHSLLEVSGSCHSEFVELLQDARYFAFDKEWLDGVERRALFPEIQVSPDALEKLLDSKKQVTKKVEDLRLKIDILSQHVEDLKHQLTSYEADLESIIQQEAVLSAPIGY